MIKSEKKYRNDLNFFRQIGLANSVDPDQTAPI